MEMCFCQSTHRPQFGISAGCCVDAECGEKRSSSSVILRHVFVRRMSKTPLMAEDVSMQA